MNVVIIAISAVKAYFSCQPKLLSEMAGGGYCVACVLWNLSRTEHEMKKSTSNKEAAERTVEA